MLDSIPALLQTHSAPLQTLPHSLSAVSFNKALKQFKSWFSSADVPYVQQIQNQTVLLPATTMFNCTARAYTAPTIQWLVVMDGITVPIPTTSRFTVTNSVIPHDCICQVQASTLLVSSLTPYDATQYICRATNSEGSTDSTATLTIQGKACDYNYALRLIFFIL